jgi:outer membrane protein assembly factor BamD (BamD/ComL family)
VVGDAATAARLYAEVAAQHPGTLAGEIASFAQARAELRAGDSNAARGSFERYVARYPNGRFSKEALGHLEDLRRSHDKK